MAAHETDAGIEEGNQRRKRLAYRANHTGARELDIVLGGFATREVATLDTFELDAFERLLGHSDPDLLSWLVGGAAIPPTLDGPLIARIRNGAARR